MNEPLHAILESKCLISDISYTTFKDEDDLKELSNLIDSQLSEPYSIYIYRYFLYQWPEHCFIARKGEGNEIIGVIICRLDMHEGVYRGYIGMIAVKEEERRKGIARHLAELAMQEFRRAGAKEIALETEYDNYQASSLYESLGFFRCKRLFRYYQNGKDAFRFIYYIE